jgi:hypothetical protein
MFEDMVVIKASSDSFTTSLLGVAIVTAVSYMIGLTLSSEIPTEFQSLPLMSNGGLPLPNVFTK